MERRRVCVVIREADPAADLPGPAWGPPSLRRHRALGIAQVYSHEHRARPEGSPSEEVVP
jgi:hypothetical protein